MRNTRPHFIGIGGIHTGWQTLLPLLTAHPAVSNSIKNTNFFSQAVVTSEEIDQYVQQFSNEGSDCVTGECSPAYLTHKIVPSRIAQCCPDTKLIAVISHPLQRLVEEWKHREAGKQKPLRCYDFAVQHKHALERGLYGEALTRYYSYYSPLQLQVIVYEDFLADPLGVMKSLYEFLGVNKEFIPLTLKAYTPVEDEPKRKPFIVKRIITFLPRWYRRYRDNKAQIKVVPPPSLSRSLSSEEKDELMSYYQGDIAVASTLVERNLAEIWK